MQLVWPLIYILYMTQFVPCLVLVRYIRSLVRRPYAFCVAANSSLTTRIWQQWISSCSVSTNYQQYVSSCKFILFCPPIRCSINLYWLKFHVSRYSFFFDFNKSSIFPSLNPDTRCNKTNRRLISALANLWLKTTVELADGSGNNTRITAVISIMIRRSVSNNNNNNRLLMPMNWWMLIMTIGRI